MGNALATLPDPGPYPSRVEFSFVGPTTVPRKRKLEEGEEQETIPVYKPRVWNIPPFRTTEQTAEENSDNADAPHRCFGNHRVYPLVISAGDSARPPKRFCDCSSRSQSRYPSGPMLFLPSVPGDPSRFPFNCIPFSELESRQSDNPKVPAGPSAQKVSSRDRESKPAALPKSSPGVNEKPATDEGEEPLLLDLRTASPSGHHSLNKRADHRVERMVDSTPLSKVASSSVDDPGTATTAISPQQKTLKDQSSNPVTLTVVQSLPSDVHQTDDEPVACVEVVEDQSQASATGETVTTPPRVEIDTILPMTIKVPDISITMTVELYRKMKMPMIGDTETRRWYNDDNMMIGMELVFRELEKMSGLENVRASTLVIPPWVTASLSTETLTVREEWIDRVSMDIFDKDIWIAPCCVGDHWIMVAVLSPSNVSSPLPSSSRRIFQYDKTEQGGKGLSIESRLVLHYLMANPRPKGYIATSNDILKASRLFGCSDQDITIEDAVLAGVAGHTRGTRKAMVGTLLDMDDGPAFTERVVGYHYTRDIPESSERMDEDKQVSSLDEQSPEDAIPVAIFPQPTFVVCDSLGHDRISTLKHFKRNIYDKLIERFIKGKQAVTSEGVFYQAPVPRQSNTYDCGPYSLHFARKLLSTKGLLPSAEESRSYLVDEAARAVHEQKWDPAKAKIARSEFLRNAEALIWVEYQKAIANGTHHSLRAQSVSENGDVVLLEG